MTLTIGCDPELFVASRTTGVPFSAHGLIEGDKLNPKPVPGGAIQVDGMALEFNINPASTLKEFLSNISSVMANLEEDLRIANPDLEFKITPIIEFSKEYMDLVPDDAKKLGCEPDYNAYTGKMNPPPNASSTMRTAAGHIHVGWTEDQDPFDPGHFVDCQKAVKQLDCTLGTLSYLWDRDTKRRSMYGKLGAFRPKHYGAEYRVLSNQWLLDQKLTAWIFQATRKSMELLLEGVSLYEDSIFKTTHPRLLYIYLLEKFNFPILPGYKI